MVNEKSFLVKWRFLARVRRKLDPVIPLEWLTMIDLVQEDRHRDSVRKCIAFHWLSFMKMFARKALRHDCHILGPPIDS